MQELTVEYSSILTLSQRKIFLPFDAASLYSSRSFMFALPSDVGVPDPLLTMGRPQLLGLSLD